MLGGLNYFTLNAAINRAIQALGGLVTLTGSQTLTNKTLTAPIVTNPAYTAQTLTDAANVSWNMDTGSVATLTLSATGGVTRTLNAPTNVRVGTAILKLIQGDGTARGITWPAAVKWVLGSAPVLSSGAGAVDVVSFFSDGVNLYGSFMKGLA